MKQLKIYLDTSVISHLEAPDRPDWMADTRRLWEDIQAGEFEVFISPVVILEVDNCREPKRSSLTRWLQEISFTLLQEVDEVQELSEKYLQAGILPQC